MVLEMLLRHKVSFSYGHRLVHHEGKCKNLHGHNAEMEVWIEGEPSVKTGMIEDFGTIKREIDEYVGQYYDHAFMVNSEDVQVLELLRSQGWRHLVFKNEEPTIENMAARLFYRDLHRAWKAKGFASIVKLVLWETPKNGVEVSDESGVAI